MWSCGYCECVATAPSSGTRDSCCWTRQRVHWTRGGRRRCGVYSICDGDVEVPASRATIKLMHSCASSASCAFVACRSCCRSERIVQAALDKLLVEGQSSGRTTLVIAHRLSTVANVDRVVVMKHGEIVEMGSPTELRERGTFSFQVPLGHGDVKCCVSGCRSDAGNRTWQLERTSLT